MYLEVKNLVKYYQKDVPVIKKLNFSVEKGEIISFLGESGSGKTTFLKCISGLETINSGTISLNNNILNNKNIFIKPQNRKIGFVFQDYPLFPHLNLIDNITFNLKPKFFEKIDQAPKNHVKVRDSFFNKISWKSFYFHIKFIHFLQKCIKLP